jgi:hypothetical protein
MNPIHSKSVNTVVDKQVTAIIHTNKSKQTYQETCGYTIIQKENQISNEINNKKTKKTEKITKHKTRK